MEIDWISINGGCRRVGNQNSESGIKGFQRLKSKVFLFSFSLTTGLGLELKYNDKRHQI